MITLVLQGALAWALLYFAVASLMAGRGIPGPEDAHRAAWIGTGVIFSAYAVNMIVQSTWAAAAYVQGAESSAYRGFITLSPVFNHSRTFLLFVLYGMLAAVAFAPTRRWARTLLFPAVVVALGLGAAFGFSEGAMQAARHFTTTAVIDTAGFVLLGSVLLLLIARNAVDRWLWFALLLQGVFSIMGVIFLTAMAWADAEGSWTPPFWSLAALRFALALGMAVLATMRLRDARRSIRTPGLLEPLRTRPHISIG